MQEYKVLNITLISIITGLVWIQVISHDMGFDSHIGEKFD